MIFYTMDIQVTFEFFSILIDYSDIHIFPSLHVVNDPRLLQNPEMAEPSLNVLEKFKHHLDVICIMSPTILVKIQFTLILKILVWYL